jgi:hypothetical protein
MRRKNSKKVGSSLLRFVILGYLLLLSNTHAAFGKEVKENEWIFSKSSTDEGFFAALGLKVDENSMLIYKVSHLKINDCTSEHSIMSVPFVLSQNDAVNNYNGYGKQEITVLAGGTAQTFLPYEVHTNGAIERFCFPSDQCWGFDVEFRLLEPPEVRLEDGIWRNFKKPRNADALNKALQACLALK